MGSGLELLLEHLGKWLLFLMGYPGRYYILLPACSHGQSCLGKKPPLRFPTTNSEHLNPAVPEGPHTLAFLVMTIR